MLYATWLLGGLLLGILVEDMRRALVLMVLVLVAVFGLVLILGHAAFPLADSAGLLALPLIGVFATLAGHRLRQAVFSRASRLSSAFRR